MRSTLSVFNLIWQTSWSLIAAPCYREKMGILSNFEVESCKGTCWNAFENSSFFLKSTDRQTLANYHEAVFYWRMYVPPLHHKGNRWLWVICWVSLHVMAIICRSDGKRSAHGKIKIRNSRTTQIIWFILAVELGRVGNSSNWSQVQVSYGS